MKNSTKLKIATIGTATAGIAASGVTATPLLANDSFDFLSGLGVNLGTFINAIIPGLSALIMVLAIIGAVVGIFFAIAHLIGKGISGRHHR